MRMRITVFICSLLGAAIAVRAQPVQAVDARPFFGPAVRCDKDNPITIEVPAGSPLLFDARYNSEYVLHGCSLYIKATVLRVIGDVIVRAFDDLEFPLVQEEFPGVGDHGRHVFACSGGDCNGEDGQPGPIGKTGSEGFDAGLMTLDVADVVGNGTLTLLNRGSRGGRGGPGGTGGDGGPGGDWPEFKCTPIGFGRGGAGGPGGSGGPGGRGGSGGPIFFRPSLEQLVRNGVIRLDSSGGPGGPGGAAGAPGSPGPSGHSGKLGWCGVMGTRDPGLFVEPPTLQPTRTGLAGSAGPSSLKDAGDYVRVEVFYATDRKKLAEGNYVGDRNEDGHLRLGSCQVSIPRNHKEAVIETPSFWKFEFRANPKRHIMVLSVQEQAYQDFYGALSRRVTSSPRAETFVFIHGYNVAFDDAIRRTAQLATDLKFNGPAIAYSWPSAAELAKYPADETSVEWTVPHLRWFLEDLARLSGARTINLIAHSMGNRALTSALRSMMVERRTGSPPRFRQIVMAAPDIDAGVFSEIAGAIQGSGDRITIYASSRDRAILASQKFHKYPRVGEAGPNITVLPGLDTIDASGVETDIIEHSYFGDARSVLSDIFELFKSNLPPSARFGLSGTSLGSKRYWVFSP